MSNWVTAIAVNSLCVGFLASSAFCYQSLTTQKFPEQLSTFHSLNQQPVEITSELFFAAHEEKDPTHSSPTRGAGRRS